MASEPHSSTIDPKEAAHFGAHAADWWDPDGSSAMLHKLGPVRLRFIRSAIDAHWGSDHNSLRPLAGKRVLDIGCGAGLVAESLARLGGQVTAVDAAPENIEVARDHARAMSLDIDYRNCGVEALEEPPFDLITALEVIEPDRHRDPRPDGRSTLRLRAERQSLGELHSSRNTPAPSSLRAFLSHERCCPPCFVQQPCSLLQPERCMAER